MALYLIGEFYCNKDAAVSYSEGDIIEIFWDTIEEEIKVQLNKVEVTSGGTINQYEIEFRKFRSDSKIITPDDEPEVDFELNNYSYRNFIYSSNGYMSRYSFCDGSYKVSFKFYESFPYAEKQREFSEECQIATCDIRKSGTIKITKASAIDANDGEVTVLAFSSNGPIKYELFNFNYETEGRFSSTISNMYPGEYTIYAKDAIGCTVTWYIEIKVDNFLKYGLYQWWTFKNKYESLRKIELYQLNYVGDATEQSYLAEKPVMLEKRGENNRREAGLYSTSLTFYPLSDNLDQYLKMLRNATEKEYFVKYYHHNGTEYYLKWQGYVTNSIYQSEWTSQKYFAEIVVNDRSADLNRFKFTDDSGNQLFGRIKALDVIRICLNKTELGLGYRIAYNLFEAGMASGATDDPLDQAYLDTSSYYQGLEPEDCYTVLQKVLISFYAQCFCMDGYWYIIGIREVANSWNYREYDEDGTYVTNGSIDPIIDIKGPTDTNRVVWLATPTVFLEENYNKTNLHITRRLRESLVNPFNERFLEGDGFVGWSKNLNGDSGSIVAADSSEIGVKLVNRILLPINEDISDLHSKRGVPKRIVEYRPDDIEGLFFTFNFSDGQGGNSYMSAIGSIEYKANDSFTLKFGIYFQFTYTARLPYVRLKYSLKVGNEYFNGNGSWDSLETPNVYFLDKFNELTTIEISGEFSDKVTVDTVADFELRIYDIDPYDADISGSGSLDATIRAIDTSTLSLGNKLSTYRSELFELQYYELRNAINNSGIEPNDNSDRRWVNIATASLPNPSGSGQRLSAQSSVFYSSVFFLSLPGGKGLAEDTSLTFEGNKNNVIDFDLPIFHFDVNTDINNSENLILNHITLVDGTPTASWGVDELKLQEVIGRELANQYRVAKYRINGNLLSDLDLTFYSCIRNPSDSNRSYMPVAMNINDKSMQVSIEMLEVQSDDDEDFREFGSDFSDEDFN